MKDPLRQNLDAAGERHAPVLIPEKARIGESRSQHPFIPRDDRLAMVQSFVVGNEQKSRRRRAVGVQAGEIFLVRAHRSREDFGRKRHVLGVDCAGEHNRQLHRVSDLVEQPGIWFEYKSLVRSCCLEILPDDFLAAFLIQYDARRAETFQVFSRVGDADLARRQKTVTSSDPSDRNPVERQWEGLAVEQKDDRRQRPNPA